MTQLQVLPGARQPVAFGASFAEVLALSAAEQVDWFRRAHHQAVSGRYGEVVALTAIDESRAYESMGCSSIQQFGARVAEWSPRQVRDRLRIGRTLRQCPELDAAFRSGRLSWSKVRTLIPVVTRETQGGWIEKAGHVSTAILERMVGRQREPDGVPGMAPMPEVPIAVLVAFRQLCGRVRQRLGQAGMPDGECAGVLLALAGWALEQHGDEALGALECSEAKEATPPTEATPPAEATPREEEAVPIERCEPAGPVAEEGALPKTEPVPPPTSSSSEPCWADGAACRARDQSGQPEGEATTHVGHGLSSDPPITVCDPRSTDTDYTDQCVNRSRHVPTAVRRFVMARAGWRCEAPDCRSSHALELHHHIPFAHGGTHTADNFHVWCRPCHVVWHRTSERPRES